MAIRPGQIREFENGNRYRITKTGKSKTTGVAEGRSTKVLTAHTSSWEKLTKVVKRG